MHGVLRTSKAERFEVESVVLLAIYGFLMTLFVFAALKGLVFAESGNAWEALVHISFFGICSAVAFVWSGYLARKSDKHAAQKDKNWARSHKNMRRIATFLALVLGYILAVE
ncbi:MAG TPA: hypothetical protein VEA59_01790 [Patescibacteria group bacterium]|nr:hypothetical protein [Patescibacteria group bacterium]